MKNKNFAEKKDSKKSINSYAKENKLVCNSDHTFDSGNPILTDENKRLYGNNSNLYTKEYVTEGVIPVNNEKNNNK